MVIVISKDFSQDIFTSNLRNIAREKQIVGVAFANLKRLLNGSTDDISSQNIMPPTPQHLQLPLS